MPVWPICFWSRWPSMAEASMRQPTASTPMSAIPAPASSRAPRAASLARSTVSLSGYRPNFVMAVPMIHTVSATVAPCPRGCSAATAVARGSGGGEGEGDRLGPLLVPAAGEGREPHLHAEIDLLGLRARLDQVGLHHAATVELDDAGDVGDRDRRSGPIDDREGPERPGLGQVLLGELPLPAPRAGVAAVEEEGAAGGAGVGDEVRIGVEDEIVDDRDALGGAGVAHGGRT